MAAHGAPGRYNDGCRCDICREAHRLRHAQVVAALRARRVLVDGRWVAPLADDRHGTWTAYSQHGCQCEPCMTAGSARNKAYRAQRKVRRAAA